jgi:DNA-binding MarR family transcriptional regulator
MSNELSETELRAWQAFLHAHQAVTSKLDAELRAAYGLSLADYDVLLRLANAGSRGLRMTELAERVMTSPSTLTRRVDGLVGLGMVERRRFEGDSRVMLARLTTRGRELVRRAAVVHLRGIRAHFVGRLTEAQLRNVATALEVIVGPHQPH